MIGNGKNSENVTVYNCTISLPKKGVKTNLPNSSKINDFNSSLIEDAEDGNQGLLAELKKEYNGFFVFTRWNGKVNVVKAISTTFSGFLVNIKDATYKYEGSDVLQTAIYIKDAAEGEVYVLKLPFNRVSNFFFNRLLNLDVETTNDEGKVIPRYLKITSYHSKDKVNNKDYGVAMSLKTYEAKLDVDPLKDEATSVKFRFNGDGVCNNGSDVNVGKIIFTERNGKHIVNVESRMDYEESMFSLLMALGKFLGDNVKYTDFGSIAKKSPVLPSTENSTAPTTNEGFVPEEDDSMFEDATVESESDDNEFDPDSDLDGMFDDDGSDDDLPY